MRCRYIGSIEPLRESLLGKDLTRPDMAILRAAIKDIIKNKLTLPDVCTIGGMQRLPLSKTPFKSYFLHP